MYVPYNTKKIHIAYKSKHDLTREKHVVLLITSNGENWLYLVVKSLPELLEGITSRTKLEEYKKICENNKYSHVEMPNKDNNIIKYNQGEKSIKLPFVIHADLECLLEKMDTCYNYPNES